MIRVSSHLTALASVLLLAACSGGGGSRGPLIPASAATGGSSATSPASTPGTSGPVPLVAGWAPYWSTAAVNDTIRREIATLDIVHFFWYSTRADGTLAAQAAVDPQMVAFCQQNGTLVIPTVTDAFAAGRAESIFKDSALRAAHVQALLDLVDQKGYDGLDLDYEAMTDTTRDLFSAFVEDLSLDLHARGKLLTVAVYGKTSEPGGWSGPKSHDYARLGAACDRLNIMGYGYGYAGGPPNPIGPIHWLRRVLDFATTAVAPGKVVLGVNFYGRDWPQGSNGQALTSVQADALLQTYNPTVTYDPNDGESRFTYTDGGGVDHIVYYASPRGMLDKTALIPAYGLAGLAIWRLGDEDPALWTSIRTVLSPVP